VRHGQVARLYGGAIAVMLIDGQDFAAPLRVESVRRAVSLTRFLLFAFGESFM
jgi:hypothetical protein